MAKMSQQGLTLGKNAVIIRMLSLAVKQEKKAARRVIWAQMLVTVFGASAVIGWGSSPQNAIAVLGGGGISILNGALLAWRMLPATQRPIHDAHQQLRLMYFYATERFLAVVMMLCLVLVALKDSPLMVIVGFVLGQATLLAVRLLLKIKTESGSKNVR